MNIIKYKKNLEKTFDDVSSRYDDNRFFSIAAKQMADMIPSSQTMRVLDLSTGTGTVAIEVATKLPHANINAIDLSIEMLNRAKEKSKEKGINNISFKKCDVDDIDYHDETFDVVTCGYALFFYPDMEESYKRVCKKIKPGGVLVFSTFTKEAFNPYATLFLNRLDSGYSIKVPSRLRDRLKTKQQIEELVGTSKIGSVKVVHQPIRYSVTINEWWSLLNNAGYKSLLDQLNHEQLRRFKNDHLKEIEEVSTEGSIELNADTLFAIVRV